MTYSEYILNMICVTYVLHSYYLTKYILFLRTLFFIRITGFGVSILLHSLHKVPLNILVIIVNIYNRCYVMLFYIHIIIFRIYIYAHNFNSIWINVSGISEVTVTKFIIRDTTGHKFTVRVFKLHHKVTVFTHI